MFSSRSAASSLATFAFAKVSRACSTLLSVISRNSAGTSIFGISYFGRPNGEAAGFAVVPLVVASVMEVSFACGQNLIIARPGLTPRTAGPVPRQQRVLCRRRPRELSRDLSLSLLIYDFYCLAHMVVARCNVQRLIDNIFSFLDFAFSQRAQKSWCETR